VVFGNSDQEVSCALNHLKDLENNRLLESAKLREENFVLVEDASTVCSIDDYIDLEALNLICSDIAEGLSDGCCDLLILQTPVSQKSGRRPSRKKKNKNNKSSSR